MEPTESIQKRNAYQGMLAISTKKVATIRTKAICWIQGFSSCERAEEERGVQTVCNFKTVIEFRVLN